MGHLPTRTRGGRCLLPLLGLFVLLKVGRSPPRPGGRAPPALLRLRSAAGEARAPGRAGRSGRAAWRTLCCSCVCKFPAVLRGRVEASGSLRLPVFTLRAFPAAGTHVRGGQKEVPCPSGRCVLHPRAAYPPRPPPTRRAPALCEFTFRWNDTRRAELPGRRWTTARGGGGS